MNQSIPQSIQDETPSENPEQSQLQVRWEKIQARPLTVEGVDTAVSIVLRGLDNCTIDRRHEGQAISYEITFHFAGPESTLTSTIMGKYMIVPQDGLAKHWLIWGGLDFGHLEVWEAIISALEQLPQNTAVKEKYTTSQSVPQDAATAVTAEFFISTAADYVVNWLKDYTTSIWGEPRPQYFLGAGEDTISLSSATVPHKNDIIFGPTLPRPFRKPTYTTLVMYTNLNHFEDGVLKFIEGYGLGIEFKVIKLKSKRTELQAICHERLCYSDFQTLIAEIHKRWPETAAQETAVPSQEQAQETAVNLPNLVKKIDTHFSLAEMNDLIFNLGEEPENIPSDIKSGKARELVTYFDRRGRLAELLALCRQERPLVSWP